MESRELFYWGECFVPRARETASQQLWENSSKEAGEVRLYTSLQKREQAVWTSKVRYQVKEFSILQYGKMQASGLTEFIPFKCNSDIWDQSSFLVHPASCIFTVPQRWGCWAGDGSIHWITVLGALIHIWRPEISRWWLWHFLLINMAEDIFISHSPAKYFEALPRSYCNTGSPKSFTEANH